MSIGTGEDTDEPGGAKDEERLSADAAVHSRLSAAITQLDVAAGCCLKLRLPRPPLQLQQPIGVQQQEASAGSKRQDEQRLEPAHIWNQTRDQK